MAQNAFSAHLSHFGFNIFCALVVDLLHELEINVWKMLFMHLLRIVEAKTRDSLTNWTGATIQKFLANSSEMKQMAARNFKDLLRCSIPVFDCLLPEPYNTAVLKLLFIMTHWHILAKLRMHSDLTLNIMDFVTSTVGQQFREFKAKVCSVYDTHELRQEVEACAQCHAKLAVTQKGKQKQGAVVEAENPARNTQQTKVFNFQTYKFHALGDYVSTIHQYDGTFQGELEHCLPKARYRHTDRKSFVRQLTRIKCCQACIRRIGDDIVHRPHIELAEIATSPNIHHHIGLMQKYPIHIGSYLRSHEGDPAIKNFVLKLKEHLVC
ncbi:hypothetical protein EV424DRAFT_1539867 [Suillus variegatus]|nr:hypothetical protein EV424DRAFT_1539867 [Suillus variegatus]